MRQEGSHISLCFTVNRQIKCYNLISFFLLSWLAFWMPLSVKSVQIRSFFWSVFSPNAGKNGPEKTAYLDTFHAVPGMILRLVDNISKHKMHIATVIESMIIIFFDIIQIVIRVMNELPYTLLVKLPLIKIICKVLILPRILGL